MRPLTPAVPQTSITMSNTQLQRFEVLSQLNSKQMNNGEASEKLGVSTRQIRRLKVRVREKGAKGLLHRNTGTVSKRKIGEDTKKTIRSLLTTVYTGYGPTFASEKLTELNSLGVSREWLRGFMITEGLWTPKPKRSGVTHHAWRPRMELRGTMEQFDGSYHHWIEGLDEEQCLLLTIDDATGEITKAHFDYNEGVRAVFTFWRDYTLEHQHLPKKLYVDKFSTYKVNHKHAVDNPDMITQFDRVLRGLGVELICAHSPQAKGRVERVFGTLQDRLVKEMTLAGVRTIAEANAFLLTYLPKFNAQFGVRAAKDGNAYVPVLPTTDLVQVFSTQDERVVANDFTVRFENAWYQITREQSSTVRPRDTIIMEKRLDGSVGMRLKRTDHYLNIAHLPQRPEHTKSPAFIAAKTRAPHIPAANHPWRQKLTPKILAPEIVTA